jgi:hypothetical protein
VPTKGDFLDMLNHLGLELMIINNHQISWHPEDPQVKEIKKFFGATKSIWSSTYTIYENPSEVKNQSSLYFLCPDGILSSQKYRGKNCRCLKE